MSLIRATLVLLLTAALPVVHGCFDSTGPRPRPGTDVPEPPSSEEAVLQWFELVPRVISQGRPDSIELSVAAGTEVDAVSFLPRTGGSISLRRSSTGTYTAKLSPATLLFGYRSGDLHNLGGLIEVVAGRSTQNYALIVNVKDATVPTVNFTTPAPGVQATDYLVNIRHDEIRPGAEVPAAALRRFYDHFSDDYTFIAVVEQVSSPKAPFFVGVRNAISGIGLSHFDRGGGFGSAARLEGIIQYPRDTDFDPAEADDIHEIAHRWMNYLTQPLVTGARPHWPLSSLAIGVLGWRDPVADTARAFPFEITRQADGTHLLRSADQPRVFNDLELYLMGLLPADSVQTHFVFADQEQRSQVRNNGVLRGAVDSLRITEIISRDGVRTPPATEAPRDFRLATIVLSRNRILTRDELSFFHYMAARGEQRAALPFSNGLTRGTTVPFSIATSGRATLTTRLRPATPQ